jgi:hypothetical protein
MWNGPADHSAAFALAWTPESLYLSVKVFDDTHQNPGSGWNGDALQMLFANAARTKTYDNLATGAHAGSVGTTRTGEIDTPGGMIMYNFGMGDDGSYALHHDGPNPCADDCFKAACVRNDTSMITTYEVVFPAQALGRESFERGFAFGLGMTVNDGDTGRNQDGQGGWSAWSPHGLLNGGKAADDNGLATLVGPIFGDPVWPSRDYRVTTKGSTSRAAQQRSSCISADGSVVSATHSLFEGNAGGDVITARAGSTVDLGHSTFQQNDVAAAGAVASVGRRRLGTDERQSGAVSLREGSVATLVGTSFIGNLGGVAGAIAASDGSIVTFDQGIFQENEAGMLAPWHWR